MSTDLQFFWPSDETGEVLVGNPAAVHWTKLRNIEAYFKQFPPAPGQKGGEELYDCYVTYHRHETLPHVALNIL